MPSMTSISNIFCIARRILTRDALICWLMTFIITLLHETLMAALKDYPTNMQEMLNHILACEQDNLGWDSSAKTRFPK